MPKLLLVIDNLEFGGGERVFLQLASSLRHRFEIFFAGMPGGRLDRELHRLGIQLHPVEMDRQLSLKPICQINRIIRINKIDMVHSQGARADFFSRVAGRLANTPYILSTIAMPVEGFDVGHSRKVIYRLMDQLSERFVRRFIAVSDSLRTRLIEERGIPSERVVRIYNGIELDQYHPDLGETSLRDNWHIPSSATLVGTIGRMVWQKGFEFLIRAIPEIIRYLHDIRFLFVGDGPLKSDLDSLARRLEISDKVIFTDFRSDISRVLSSIDLLVVPSILEGFPMITLEGMAMSKPIVATAIQGITEQITDGQEGILVPPRNPKALSGAITRILQDKELASRLGLRARSRVESCFSIERMVRETERLYLSLL
jgi:glycosyltransferase involved in cell wall biosynthesis